MGWDIRIGLGSSWEHTKGRRPHGRVSQRPGRNCLQTMIYATYLDINRSPIIISSSSPQATSGQCIRDSEESTLHE